MSGFFGIASKKECITELFYGTDYHSHLGTNRAGMSTFDVENGKVHLNIHNISNSYFRTKFMNDLEEMKGKLGIGVISDTEPQPVVVNSHLGRFAVCTVARINNVKELTQECLAKHQQFAELSMGGTNATELVALLITQGDTLVEGITNVFNKVKGSCSMLVLTEEGIYCARDRYGRTPIVIGKGEHGYAVASENHSFVNLGYETVKYVGPGEIVRVTSDDIKTVKEPYDKMQICSFLWIYYGYPCVE
ncbi:MAG: amidophosphoribosyltransferase, partial [Bacteroidales bacterium]|nr:amidophosphoribosyltransferase [Bacteroidales bacterium]